MSLHLLRFLIAIGLLAVAAPAAHATTSPEAEKLFKALDKNGDNLLDEQELTAALTPVLIHLAAIEQISPPDDLVRRVVTRALNNIRRNDVRMDDVDAFLKYRLDPPFALSLRALLLRQDAPSKPDGGNASKWKDWVQLRQSAVDEAGSGKPAKFSYASRDTGDESKPKDPVSQWQVNAAIALSSQHDLGEKPNRSQADRALHITPLAAYEVQVNSDKKTADRIIHRGGIVGSVTPKSGAIDSHYLFATFDYTTDRGYDARIFGATVEYSPTVLNWLIGAANEGKDVRFRWRPYLGLVYGHVAEAGPLTDLDDDYTNLMLRVTPELVLFDRVALAPLLEWAQQLQGDKKAHGYYEWAGRLILFDADSRQASLELSYNTGRQSPAFQKTGVFAAALAVKF